VFFIIQERNIGDRREGDKGTKGIKKRKKVSEVLRYERNHFSLNFSGLFALVRHNTNI
jgi:hypothetical protein